MPSVITNLPALFAQRTISRQQGEVATAMARLSSGLRVNSAKDDAAGLAISTRMAADVNGSAQVSRGILDGVGILQGAEGALGVVSAMLQRARELAVQASNGPLQDADRGALNAEYLQLLSEVDRVARSTQVMGVFPLRGAVEDSLGSTPHMTDIFPASGTSRTMPSGIQPIAFIPAGATGVQIDIDSYGADDDIQLFTLDGTHLVGTPLSDAVWQNNAVNSVAEADAKVLTAAAGFLATASYVASTLLDGSALFANPATAPPGAGLATSHAGMNILYSGDGDHTDAAPNNGSVSGGLTRERVSIDATTQPLMVMVLGSGVFNATATWTGMPPAAPPDPPYRTAPVEILVDPGSDSEDRFVTIRQTPATASSLGLTGSNVATRDTATAALLLLDTAIDTVVGFRAMHGAVASRFDASLAVLQESSLNTRAAHGRIVDADYATESAQQLRSQILLNAGQAMLTQANVLPQQVMKLLQG